MSLALVRDFDDDAERAVLGAILFSHGACVLECVKLPLTWHDFADVRHQCLYAASVELTKIGRGVDPLTLVAYLGERDALERAGGRAYIGGLLGEVPTDRRVRHHAQLVKQGARHRAGHDDAVTRDTQAAQVGDAQAFLDLDASAFFRFPWPALDKLVGGIAPGTLSFLAGHPGGGKTSFLLTLITRLVAQGKRVMYAGLETRPDRLRSQVAARVLNMDPGPLFSGDAQMRPDWPAVQSAIKAEVERQRTDAVWTERLRFAPHEHVDARAAVEIMAEAKDFDAGLVVIDHVDHVTAEGKSGWGESRAIVQVFDTATKRNGLVTLAATQTNNEGEARDPFQAHRHITPKQIYMGKHKEQVAEMFLGVYRPLRSVPPVRPDERLDVRENLRKLDELLAVATTRVHVLKSRTGVANPGAWVDLGYWYGEVLDEIPRVLRPYNGTAGAA